MPNDPAPIPAQPLAAERDRLARLINNCPAERMPELYVEAKQRVRAIRDALKDIDAMGEEAGLEHAQTHGAFEIGDTRYYPGMEIKTKDRDPVTTAKAILEAADLDTLLDCLSATAFKQGAVKKIEGLNFNELFEITVEPDLKTGKPRKKLHSTSLTFNRS
jgi:hypothetical protein